MAAAKLLMGMAENASSAGESRLWELITAFPGIDPAFWLDLYARNEMKLLGCHYLGKAGPEALPPLADSVRYVAKDGQIVFRKDAVHKGLVEKSSCPQVLIGAVTARKGFRAESALQQLKLRIEHSKPDILLLDVTIQSLKSDEVSVVLTELSGPLRKLAWFPFSFGSFGLPMQSDHFLWVAGNIDTPDLDQVILKHWGSCAARAKSTVPVRSENCLAPDSGWGRFLSLQTKRRLEKKKDVGDKDGNEETPRAEPECSPEGEGKKRRKGNTIGEIANAAKEQGFLDTVSPTLPAKCLRSFEELPYQSPLVFVHAAALQRRSDEFFQTQGVRPFLLTDASLSNWKRITFWQGQLPPVRGASLILSMSGESHLHILSPEECLAMYGFDLKTVQMHLCTQSAAQSAVAECTPIPIVAAMLAVGSNLASLRKTGSVPPA